jgi:hypothetical protein
MESEQRDILDGKLSPLTALIDAATAVGGI